MDHTLIITGNGKSTKYSAKHLSRGTMNSSIIWPCDLLDILLSKKIKWGKVCNDAILKKEHTNTNTLFVYISEKEGK